MIRYILSFYLVKADKQEATKAAHKPGAAWDAAFENEFFLIEPAPSGLKRIYDKALERELLAIDRFLGAEWLDYEYKGQGAGEHVHITMPTAHRYDRLKKYAATWTCSESGPVLTAFETAPVKTPRGTVKLRLVAYASLKRINLECRMLDTDEAEARQMRLAFPLNGDPGQVAYEAPSGVVEVGRSELEPALAFGPASVRPRKIQNWIHAGGETGGVTIGSSVAVWDYAEVSHRRPPRGKYPILQPVLLTSAYSCSRWKKWWVQPGDHAFTFSLYSHKPGWRNGYRKGVQTSHLLIPVVQNGKSDGAGLAESKSFLSIYPANIIVTAIKKSEDGNDVAVRFYEAEGKSGNRVRIDPDAKLSGARRTNLIEEDAGALEHNQDSAALMVGPYSIETVRLRPKLEADGRSNR
jgi:alpha-mannosidase